MIRICSAKINENLNDITISHNIITDSFYKANFTVVGIMISKKDETIAKQLKEYNCYYYDNHKGKFEKYLRQFMVRNIIIAFDLNNIKTVRDIKKYIKTLRRIGKVCSRCKTNIGIKGENQSDIINAIILNYRESLNIKNVKLEDLIDTIKLENLKTKKNKYNYIYDKTCKMLDHEFETRNLCNFKDDKCIEKVRTNVICGCCRHYKNLFSKKLIKCEYLKNRKCAANCITCKFFTCDTLEKQGIKFKLKDFYLINYYFNNLQKFVIKSSYFTTKEKIMKRLMILGK